MACRVKRDRETGEILEVLAPNGQPSSTYNQLVKTYTNGDKEAALKYYMTGFSKEYLEYINNDRFGTIDESRGFFDDQGGWGASSPGEGVYYEDNVKEQFGKLLLKDELNFVNDLTYSQVITFDSIVNLLGKKDSEHEALLDEIAADFEDYFDKDDRLTSAIAHLNIPLEHKEQIRNLAASDIEVNREVARALLPQISSTFVEGEPTYQKFEEYYDKISDLPYYRSVQEEFKEDLFYSVLYNFADRLDDNGDLEVDKLTEFLDQIKRYKSNQLPTTYLQEIKEERVADLLQDMIPSLEDIKGTLDTISKNQKSIDDTNGEIIRRLNNKLYVAINAAENFKYEGIPIEDSLYGPFDDNDSYQEKLDFYNRISPNLPALLEIRDEIAESATDENFAKSTALHNKIAMQEIEGEYDHYIIDLLDDINKSQAIIEELTNQINLTINRLPSEYEPHKLMNILFVDGKVTEQENNIQVALDIIDSIQDSIKEDIVDTIKDTPPPRGKDPSYKNPHDSLFGLDTNNMEFHINTLGVMNNFLENLGIGTRLVPQFLRKNGTVIEGALAAANFIEGTVDIIDDVAKRPSAWNKLPEEAAHFWYRLLKTDSDLKQKLWDSAKTSDKAAALLDSDYAKLEKDDLDRDFFLSDNAIAIDDLKEEAIGQLIAEAIKRIENDEGAPADYTFLESFIAFINELIDSFKELFDKKDPFKVAAMKILTSDMTDLMSWEEYHALNKEVYFGEYFTHQDTGPLDYTLLNDEGVYSVQQVDEATTIHTFVPHRKSTRRRDGRELELIDAYGPAGINNAVSFETKEELDRYLLEKYSDIFRPNETRLQEIKDSEVFFDRLLNKTYRRRTKFLTKTLDKYYKIVDKASETGKGVDKWDVNLSYMKTIRTLSEEEKTILNNTTGYTNVTPTLKVLPEVLKKYKKQPISLSEEFKLGGAKKQELDIIQSVISLIKKDNPELKSVSAEELVNEIHTYLEFNHALGFANENANFLGYRIDQIFEHVPDRVSTTDIDVVNMTEAELMILPPAARANIQEVLGLTKKDPKVHHNKISIRFNDAYLTQAPQQHWNKGPVAWGNLTYFYSTPESKVKDAVLIHEIQSDYLEDLWRTKEQVDLDYQLNKHLRDLNDALIYNLEHVGESKKAVRIHPEGQSMFRNMGSKFINGLIEGELIALPYNQGIVRLKAAAEEKVDLYKDAEEALTKGYEKLKKQYAKKRKVENFLNMDGLNGILTDADKEAIRDILSRANDPIIKSVQRYDESQEEVYYEEVIDDDIDNKKNKVEEEINTYFEETYKTSEPKLAGIPANPYNDIYSFSHFIQIKLNEIYGVDDFEYDYFNAAPSIQPRTGYTKLNTSFKAYLFMVEKGMLDNQNRVISISKEGINTLYKNKSMFTFSNTLLDITPKQYATLLDNYKFNLDLLETSIEQQIKKKTQSVEGILDSLQDHLYANNESLIPNSNYSFVWGAGDTGVKDSHPVAVFKIEDFDALTFEYKENWTADQVADYIKKKAPHLLESITPSEKAIAEETAKIEALKDKAIAKKEELAKKHGKKLIAATKKIDENLEYFTPLVHSMIQKHIKQVGKGIPMYFAGFDATLLTQGESAFHTALIYAGPDEINTVRSKFEIGNVSYTTTADKKNYFINETGKRDEHGHLDWSPISKKKYDKAYAKAVKLKADEIKIKAAHQLGLAKKDATIKEAQDALKKYKNSSPIGQPEAHKKEIINRILFISGNRPIEPGALYNAFKKVAGINLSYQDKINGLKKDAGGYLVDLTHYHYNVPILYALEDKGRPEKRLPLDEKEYTAARDLGFDRTTSNEIARTSLDEDTDIKPVMGMQPVKAINELREFMTATLFDHEYYGIYGARKFFTDDIYVTLDREFSTLTNYINKEDPTLLSKIRNVAKESLKIENELSKIDEEYGDKEEAETAIDNLHEEEDILANHGRPLINKAIKIVLDGIKKDLYKVDPDAVNILDFLFIQEENEFGFPLSYQGDSWDGQRLQSEENIELGETFLSTYFPTTKGPMGMAPININDSKYIDLMGRAFEDTVRRLDESIRWKPRLNLEYNLKSKINLLDDLTNFFNLETKVFVNKENTTYEFRTKVKEGHQQNFGTWYDEKGNERTFRVPKMGGYHLHTVIYDDLPNHGGKVYIDNDYNFRIVNKAELPSKPMHSEIHEEDGWKLVDYANLPKEVQRVHGVALLQELFETKEYVKGLQEEKDLTDYTADLLSKLFDKEEVDSIISLVSSRDKDNIELAKQLLKGKINSYNDNLTKGPMGMKPVKKAFDFIKEHAANIPGYNIEFDMFDSKHGMANLIYPAMKPSGLEEEFNVVDEIARDLKRKQQSKNMGIPNHFFIDTDLGQKMEVRKVTDEDITLLVNQLNDAKKLYTSQVRDWIDNISLTYNKETSYLKFLAINKFGKEEAENVMRFIFPDPDNRYKLSEMIDVAEGLLMPDVKPPMGMPTSTKRDQILIEGAKENIKLLFGNNIQISTAWEQALDNIALEALPGAFFLDNIIYLNDPTKWNKEAFHPVFQTMLSEKQIKYYLNEAEKELNYSPTKLAQEMRALQKDVPAYKDLPTWRLKALVYEEYLANEYGKFLDTNKPTKSWFAALFNLIKNMYTEFMGNRTHIEALFHKINNRGFRFTKPKSNKYSMKLPVFTLLKKGIFFDSFEIEHDDTIEESKSHAIIMEMAGHLYELINGPATGKVITIPDFKSNKPGTKTVQVTVTPLDALKNAESTLTKLLWDRSITYRPNNNKELLKGVKGDKEAYTKLNTRLKEKVNIYNPKFAHKSGITNGQIIWAEVKKRFELYGADYLSEKNAVAARLNMVAEGREFYNMEAWEKDPLELRDRDLRLFMGFVLYETTDELTGEAVKKAIDASTVYSSLLRVLASQELEERAWMKNRATDKDPFLLLLENISKDHIQTKAFYDRLMEITGGDMEHNLMILVRKNFNLESIQFLQLLNDPNTQNAQLVNAASTNDVATQKETWESNWNDRGLSELYAKEEERVARRKSFDALEALLTPTTHKGDSILNIENVLDKFMNGFIARDGSHSHSFAEVTGIDLSRGFLRYSIRRNYDILAQENDAYTSLKDLLLEATNNNDEYAGYLDRVKNNTDYMVPEDIQRMLKIATKEYGENSKIERHIKNVLGTEDIHNIHMEAPIVTDPADAEKTIFEGGIQSRLSKLSKGNAAFDETLMAVTFQDSQNNNRSGFVKKSFSLLFSRRLRIADYRKFLVEEFPWLKDNYLFNESYFSPELIAGIFGKDFKPMHIGDVRQRSMDIPVNMYNNLDEQSDPDHGNTEDQQGATPKTITFGDFMKLQLEMFAKRDSIPYKKADSDITVSNLFTSKFYMGVNSTKLTDLALDFPIGRLNLETGKPISYTTPKGEFSNAAINVVFDMLHNELKMVKRGEDEIFEGLKDHETFYSQHPNAKELADNWVELILLRQQVRRGEVESTELSKVNGRIKALENVFAKEPTTILYEKLHVNTDKNGVIKRIHEDSKDSKSPVIGYAFGRANQLWNFKTLQGMVPELDSHIQLREKVLFLKTKQMFSEQKNAPEYGKFTDEEATLLSTLEGKMNTAMDDVNFRAAIKEGIKKFLSKELDGYYQLLNRFDIAYVLEDGTIENNKLPKLPYYYPENSKTPFKLYHSDVKEGGGTPSYKWFINDFFINHFINITAFNNLHDKDPRIAANPTDRVKRNVGRVGGGDDAGKGTSNFGFLKEPELYTKFGKEVDVADAQAWMGLETFEFLLKRWGRLPDVIKPILNKIKFGLEDVNFTVEVKKLNKTNSILNSKKTMFYDSQHFHKLSYSILSRQYTSVLPNEHLAEALELKGEIEAAEKAGIDTTQLWREYELLWMPYSGHEVLHNIRRNMMFNGLNGVMPHSASKLKTPVTASEYEKHYDFTYSTLALENEYWRLQLETPSGKTKIVYPSQVLNLIDNELNPTLTYTMRGKTYEMSDLTKMYHDFLAKRVENAVKGALSEMGVLDPETGYLAELDMEKFIDKAYQTLQTSGADDAQLNFYKEKVKEGKEMKYDVPNLPATHGKFAQLFLAHYSKGVLQAQISGSKASLVSSYGNDLLVDEDDNIITRVMQKKDYFAYHDEKGKPLPHLRNRRLKWSVGYTSDTVVKYNGVEQPTITISRDEMMKKLTTTKTVNGKKVTTPHIAIKAHGIVTMTRLENLGDDMVAMMWTIVNDHLAANTANRMRGQKMVPHEFVSTDLSKMSSTNFQAYMDAYRRRGGSIFKAIESQFMKEETGTQLPVQSYEQAKKLFDKIEGNFAGDVVDQSVAEVMLTPWDLLTYNVSIGQEIDKDHPAWKNIMEQFGTRIPTQARHSMIVFKVVDFLPAYMGDIAVLPAETMWLSGEDYDIDAKYIQMKAYHMVGKTLDDIRIYGEIHNPEEVERAYIEELDTINEVLQEEGKALVPYAEGDGVKNRKWLDFVAYTKKNNRAVEFDWSKLKDEHEDSLKLEADIQKVKEDHADSIEAYSERIEKILTDIRELKEEKGFLKEAANDADLEAKVSELYKQDHATIIKEKFPQLQDFYDEKYLIQNIDKSEWRRVLNVERRINRLYTQYNLATYYKEFEDTNKLFESLNQEIDDVLKEVGFTKFNTTATREYIDQHDELYDKREEIRAIMRERKELEDPLASIKELNIQKTEALGVIAAKLNENRVAGNPLKPIYADGRELGNNLKLINKFLRKFHTDPLAYADTDLTKEIKVYTDSRRDNLTELRANNNRINELYEDLEAMKKERDFEFVDDLKSLHKMRKEYSKIFFTEALRLNNLPTSMQEYNPDAMLNNGVIDNWLLDLNKAFYLNAGVVSKTNTPASLDKFQGDRSLGEQGLENLMNNASGDFVGNFEYNTATGQMLAKISNKVGDSGIAPSAVANIVKAGLAKAGVALIKRKGQNATIKFDGKDYDTFTDYYSNDIVFTYNIDSKGNIDNIEVKQGETKMYRIMDELSTILSAMTDNAKWNTAAKVNFILETLGTYLYMVSLGMGLNRSTVMAKSPVMMHYTDIMAAKNPAFTTHRDKVTQALNPITHLKIEYRKYQKEILAQMKERAANDYPEGAPIVEYNGVSLALEDLESIEEMKSENVSLNSHAMLNDMLLMRDIRNEYGTSFINANFVEKFIKSPNTIYPELYKVYLALANQINILTAYSRISKQASYFSSVATLLRLHQGLAPSFPEQHKVYDMLDKFGIDVKALAEGKENYNTPNFEMAVEAVAPFTINKLLDKQADLRMLLVAFDKIIEASKLLFISQTDVFADVFKIAENTLRSRLKDTAETIKGIRSQMMGFIIVNAMREKYKREGKVSPLASSLVYSQKGDTILNHLQKILKLANTYKKKDLANNLFIRALKRHQEDYNKNDITRYKLPGKDYMHVIDDIRIHIDKILVNTRSRNTSDYTNRVINAYRELMQTHLKNDETGGTILLDLDTGEAVDETELPSNADRTKYKPIVAAFAKDLFNYLIVKDGLQFANGSFLKYVAPEMYLEMSDVLKELTTVFREDQWNSTPDQKGLTELLGMNKEDFTNQFIKLYGLNPKNSANLNEVSLDKLWDVHKIFKTEFGITTNPGIIKTYVTNTSTGKLVQDFEFSNSEPEFIEIDMSNIGTLIRDKFTTAIKAIFTKHGKEAVRASLPDMIYFNEDGTERYYENLYHKEKALFTTKESFNERKKAVKEKLRNNLVKYGTEEGKKKDASAIDNIVGSMLEQKSLNSFKFAGGRKVTFPRFIRMTRVEETPNDYGSTDQRSYTNLFMLINVDSNEYIDRATGETKVAREDEGFIQRQRGVYAKVDPIYTSLYPYLHTASEFKEVMLKHIKEKEDALKDKLGDAYTATSYQKLYMDELRSTVQNQKFDYELYEGPWTASTAVQTFDYTKQEEEMQLNLFEDTSKAKEPYKWARYAENNYEVSSKGDKRFSALVAKLKDGRTIEAAYQLDVKGYREEGDTNDDWKKGKGKKPIRDISKEETYQEYKALWEQWAKENPDLIKELSKKAKGKTLTDMFATTEVSQARVLSEILNESVLKPTILKLNPTSVKIPQNFVSGVESFGSLQYATDKVKKELGDNPHSIDMVELGFRKRTTRSAKEIAKYEKQKGGKLEVGDVIRQYGKSADGTTKNYDTVITGLYPKGTPEFLGTWADEGWTEAGKEHIKTYVAGAMAIQFKLKSLVEQELASEEVQEEVEETPTPITKVKKAKKKYTASMPSQFPETLFVFTENINSLESGSKRVGGGTAVIRGNENAFPIVTKKRYVYREDRAGQDIGEGWDQNFTEEEFDTTTFEDINTTQLNELETLVNSGQYENVVFPKGFASELAALPRELASWLRDQLQDRFGLITKLVQHKNGNYGLTTEGVDASLIKDASDIDIQLKLRGEKRKCD